eukprot:jgi/Tetstr1/449708/TSEL_036776.t1
MDPNYEPGKFFLYRSCERGVFSVLYYDVKLYGQNVDEGAGNSFQVVLREDGSITIAYAAVSEKMDEIDLGDDDYKELALGFDFSYFGRTFDSVFVGSNGYLTFDEGDRSYSASTEQHHALFRISGLFTDLDPSDEDCTLRVYQDDNTFAVMCTNIRDYGQQDGPHNSFLVVLREDGSITFTVTESSLECDTADDMLYVTGFSKGRPLSGSVSFCLNKVTRAPGRQRAIMSA